MAPRELVERAREARLDRIAVTDHNLLDGALEASGVDPALIIVGEEINCAGGTHLIGLFLREVIPPGLPVLEVAERIRAQGGIVYAPHPFAYAFEAQARAAEALGVADAVEVFNARAFLPSWNRRAGRAARERGLPSVAGSDSHFGHEIGSAWTELPDFATAEEFRRALPRARPVGLRTQSPFVHCLSLGVQLAKGARKLVTGDRQIYTGARARYPTPL
jgi:predicted metal-dependent phosphoesterase TrpH